MNRDCKVGLIRRSVRLKSGKVTRYWVLRWGDSQGKTQTEQIGRVGTMTRAEAESLKHDKLIAIGSGEIPRDRLKRVTLAQYVEDHELAASGKVRPTTLQSYRHAAAHAMEVIGGDITIDQIGFADLGRIEQHVIKTRSKNTACKTMRALRSMFTRAVKAGLLVKNPLMGWEMPKVEKTEKRIFTPAEISAMIDSTESIWWKMLIRLAADSGLRKSELLHLRWDDIDLTEGTVSVKGRRAGRFTSHGNEYPILEWHPKTTASTRSVPIPGATMTMLHRFNLQSGGSAYLFLSLQRLAGIDRRLVDGVLPVNVDMVNNLGKNFNAIQNRAEINPLGSLHDLRRTYCTRIAGVVPMHVLKEYAGHATIETTCAFYLKTSDDDAAKVRKALSLAG